MRGWTYRAPVDPRISSRKKTLDQPLRQALVWGVLIVGGSVAFNYLLTYSLTTEKERLAQEYHVSQDAIVIEPKPHGCAYDDAPLGNKHCHFEKFVDVQRTCPGSDCPATSVYVGWRKVEE